jgi:hypothetical protein
MVMYVTLLVFEMPTVPLSKTLLKKLNYKSKQRPAMAHTFLLTAMPSYTRVKC